MSDSVKEENNAENADRSDQATSLGTTRNIPLTPEQKKARRADIESASGRRQRTLLLWLLALLVALALGGFAWVIASQWLNSAGTAETGLTPPANNAEKSDASDDTGPISILPKQPDGVTILEKQPDTRADLNKPLLAPIAQGADIATGFAMDLGSADSFLDLTKRFATLVELNGADNFQRLEPRAVLRETITGLEARLLVGPFESENEAADACSVLVLDGGLNCTPAPFEGELISRQ